MIRDHWRTWFPASAVARVGLHETLAALAAAGVRLGVVTNGSVFTQSAKIVHLGIGPYFRCELEEIACVAAATLFVGDHPVNDVLGSAEAGLLPVWLEGIHAWPSPHAVPERRIRALLEVLEFVSSGESRQPPRLEPPSRSRERR